MPTSLVSRMPDPLCTDGVKLSVHVNHVVHSVKYLTEEQEEDILKALGATRDYSEERNYEEARDDAMSHISIMEEVQATAALLRAIRSNLSRDIKDASPDLVKSIQAINNTMNTVKRLLPELSEAQQFIRLQNALITFGNTLDDDKRKQFMDAVKTALTQPIE